MNLFFAFWATYASAFATLPIDNMEHSSFIQLIQEGRVRIPSDKSCGRACYDDCSEHGDISEQCIIGCMMSLNCFDLDAWEQ